MIRTPSRVFGALAISAVAFAPLSAFAQTTDPTDVVAT